MSILEKVLAALLAFALASGFGALWYADHERARAALADNNARIAAQVARQAAADREAAQAAASAAQAQLRAADNATRSAQESAAQAQAVAKDAKGKLAAAAKLPDAAKVLDTEVPQQVWDAIYNKGK